MWECVSFSVEETCSSDGPSWWGQAGKVCDPRSWHLCLPGPACSPPPWPLQFSCWPWWAWSWPSGPARCSLETQCSQQWLCCCCCSSLESQSSSGGSPRAPVLFTSRYVTFYAQSVHLEWKGSVYFRSKHTCRTREEEKLLKPVNTSLIHTQCFIYPTSVGTEGRAWTEWKSSHPHDVRSPSQTSGCVQGWTDSAHRSLLCLSSHWWASFWTFTWWCRWPLGPGPSLASGMWLVSDFLGWRGFLSDWTQFSSNHLPPILCQMP